MAAILIRNRLPSFVSVASSPCAINKNWLKSSLDKVRCAIVCHMNRVTTERVAQWWQAFYTVDVISETRVDISVPSQ